MTGVLIRRGKYHVKTETQREDGHVKMEIETEVMLPQTKEDLELPEIGRGKERFSSRGLGGSMALPTPCFWISRLQNCERIHYCCFEPSTLK